MPDTPRANLGFSMLGAASLVLCLSAPLLAQSTPPADPQTTETSPADPQAPAQLSEQDQQADERVSAKLGVIFAQIDALQSVEWRVRGGLVTLTGEASAASARLRAEEIAAKLEGVLAVQNLIVLTEQPLPQDANKEVVISPEAADLALQDRLKGIFGNIEGLERVKVSVDSGIVKLSGEVTETEERAQAKELATKIDGVVHVVNKIELPTQITERVKPAWGQVQKLITKSVNALPLLIIAAIILVLSVIISSRLRKWDMPYRKLEGRPLVRQLVKQVVGTVVLGLGVLLALEILDVTAFIGALLGTAGLAGLALGFAFQDIVENYLSSVMLSARQPYRKGDSIKINDHTGKVVRMTMRDTVLMTFDGNHVRIPNAQVFKSVITNFSHNPRRRFQFSVGVGTQESLLDAQRIGLKTLQDIPGILHDPSPYMVIDSLGDSSVVCIFYAWLDQRETDFQATRSEAIRRIKVRFEAEGFDLPEPIYRLNLLHPLFPGAGPEASIQAEQEPQKPADPVEDSTFLTSINEDEHLDEQLRHTDDREQEDLL